MGCALQVRTVQRVVHTQEMGGLDFQDLVILVEAAAAVLTIQSTAPPENHPPEGQLEMEPGLEAEVEEVFVRVEMEERMGVAQGVVQFKVHQRFMEVEEDMAEVMGDLDQRMEISQY